MNTVTTAARAFVANAVADPDDRANLLVAADWYAENGESLREEWCRCTVEVANAGPKPRELFVADGAGTRMEGLGVALIYEGDGHYTASSGERGLSTETFAPNERVDIYADRPGKGIKWMRGLRYVKHVPHRECIVFRKDDKSGPWAGMKPTARLRELETALTPAWPCPGTCKGMGNKAPGPLCVTCGGTGDVLTASNGDAWFVYPLTFACGHLVGVTLPRLVDAVEEVEGIGAYNVGDGTRYDLNRWQPTPRLRALCQPRDVPLAWVFAGDRESTQNSRNHCWMWVRGDTGSGLRDEIPSPLFDCLVDGPRQHSPFHVFNRPGDWLSWDTARAAKLALAAAIAAFGRTG